MHSRYLNCPCGSRTCRCQNPCCCSPEKDCFCSTCLGYKMEAIRMMCRGKDSTPEHNWQATGGYKREMESPLSNKLPHSGGSSDAGRLTSEASNSSRESETEELMFQMDDIDSPPKAAESIPVSSNIGGPSGNLRPCPNITLSNPWQSQKSKEQGVIGRPIIGRRYSQQDLSANALRSKESKIETSPRINPNRTVSKPKESQVTETSINQNASSEVNPSIVISIPEDKITDNSITQDLPRSSESDSSKNTENPGELQVTDILGSVSSPSNMYSSDSLPSGLFSDDDDSQSSHSSAERSPTQILSTSAPAEYDVPEPFIELESPKHETSDIPNSSEESITSNLPGAETSMVSVSQQTDEEKAQIELSLSIETLSTDNIEANANDDLPPLYFSVSPSLTASTVSSSPKTPPMSYTENSFNIPSPELSKQDSKKSSSESSSSIETLSAEPSEEKCEDKPRKSMSPKKDN